MKMERWQSVCECPSCHQMRGCGDFYTYADHEHGIGTDDWSAGPDSIRMCRVCLYRHLSRYYPGSPAHQAVSADLMDEERQELGLVPIFDPASERGTVSGLVPQMALGLGGWQNGRSGYD